MSYIDADHILEAITEAMGEKGRVVTQWKPVEESSDGGAMMVEVTCAGSVVQALRAVHIPGERCTHEHDCCGQVYFGGMRVVATDKCWYSMWGVEPSHTVFIQASWTRNI